MHYQPLPKVLKLVARFFVTDALRSSETALYAALRQFADNLQKENLVEAKLQITQCQSIVGELASK